MEEEPENLKTLKVEKRELGFGFDGDAMLSRKH